ncbi:hypothetical protein NSB25_07735 [Acetatifactor muris]|uniref:Uncharacterized protein n=1 Tax=Acetatifactor muris TaxID=879566 RepID=A0A2K4ZE87_9FIRM|nr:hypothetical protein [Acetatifactor muris]MCR2047166.1 hypothetical protein [Acetatifactor muris]SOY28776.1 hypothetical protein AMURIS_01487 [Acetatifactor muris]
MAYIDPSLNKSYRFDCFVERLSKLPFIRIALFDAIAGITLSLVGLNVVSRFFFFGIPIAIVAKILSAFLCGVEHPVTKFWLMSLFVGIEALIVSGMLMPYCGNTESTVSGVVTIVCALFAGLGSLTLILAAIGFLIRIFIAFFIN